MRARRTNLMTTAAVQILIVVCAGTAGAGSWFQRDRRVRLDLERGHVEVQITPEGGGPIALARRGRNLWSYEGPTAELVGTPYVITLRNRTPERIKIVVGVDGLNVYRRQPIVGRCDGDTGSILSPWSERTLHGWQVDNDTAQQFVFSPPEWSEGQGLTSSQIGLVVVQVYRERSSGRDREESSRHSAPGVMREQAGESRHKDAAPPIGTTSGGDVSSHVRSVYFDARTLYPEAWAEVDYGRCATRAPGVRDGVLGMRLISDPLGVRVVAVLGGSEAEQAGVEPEDVIVRIDTESRPGIARATEILGSKRAGEYVFMRVRRVHHELALKIKVAG